MAAENKAKVSLKSLSKTAAKATVKSANSSCYYWQGQPKESEKIKKLRKF